MDNNMGMAPEEFQALIVEFLTEGQEHLDILNKKLLESENAIRVGESMQDEDLNAMFRAAHTIKGTASFIGLNKTVDLTHEMETVLQKVKNKELKLDLHIIDVLFKGFDALSTIFNALMEEGEERGDTTECVALIKGILGSSDQEEETPSSPCLEESSPEPVLEETLSSSLDYDINQKYLPQFIVEAEQNIDDLDNTLLSFEKEYDPAQVNELFRFMHTIKGAAGLINEKTMHSVSHRMENIFSYIREKELKPSDEVFALLFKGVDALRSLLISLKKGTSFDYDTETLNADLDKCFKNLSEGLDFVKSSDVSSVGDFDYAKLSDDNKKVIADAVSRGEFAYLIKISVAAHVMMKSMKAILVEERLKASGKIVFTFPNVDDLDDISESAAVYFVYCSDQSVDELNALIKLDSVSLEAVEKIDETVYKVSEAKDVVDTKVEPGKNDKSKGEEPVKVKQAATSKQPAAAKQSFEISTIRIDSMKLDNLMNLSGELVITRARFAQLVGQFNEVFNVQKERTQILEELEFYFEQLAEEFKILRRHFDIKDEDASKGNLLFEHLNDRLESLRAKGVSSSLLNSNHMLDEVTGILGKISSDIQSGVMSARMVPVEGVFTRFRRVVRDISRELGKDVHMHIEGEDTELDKKIVDSLADPLTHMVRNAVDHGIEKTKEERIALGKPELGTVFLKASHRGNTICIEVGDDGKGLDAEQIVQKAIDKDIISEEEAEFLTDKEKLQLIFMPGFSTAAQVTDLSGRGVGMDVVKNMIASVNGTIDINTEMGKGTTFVLKIPLTLAIIQALLVVIGGESYALPLESVVEIVKVPVREIYSVDGVDTIKLRDHALSLVKLDDLIGIQSKELVEDELRVVVISDGDSSIGVVVDSLIGEEDIVIKSLTEHFANVNGISGASILGDGTIALITDPMAIITAAR